VVGLGHLGRGRAAADRRLVFDRHPARLHTQHVRAPLAGDVDFPRLDLLSGAGDHQAFAHFGPRHPGHRELEDHLQRLLHLDLETAANPPGPHIVHDEQYGG